MFPEDRIKDLSELPNLSEMELEDWGLPKNWSFSLGRYGFERDQWVITFTHDDLSQDVYPLPLFVTALVNMNKEWATEAVQNEIKQALGL